MKKLIEKSSISMTKEERDVGITTRNLINDMNPDLFLITLSYLSLYDIFHNFIYCETSLMKRIQKCRDILCKDMIMRYLKATNRLPEDYVMNHDQSWYQLIKGITPWPTDFDFDSIRSGTISDKIVEFKTNPRQRRSLIVYQGIRRGGNRCVVSDCHFPAISLPENRNRMMLSGDIIRSNLPFVKTTVDASSVVKLSYSLVAYFEIKIYDPVNPAPPSAMDPFIETSNSSAVPCVCIGLCLAGFNIGSHMPGWRANSFGYHGDDGKFFHGSSVQTSNILPSIIPSTFGAGDTVGCGLFYPPLGKHGKGGIFYTKNGEIVAEYSFHNVGVLANAWYPVVGTDSYNPIEMNCGQRAFEFDVITVEKGLLRRLSTSFCAESFHLNGIGIQDYLGIYTTGYHQNHHLAVMNPILKDPCKFLKSYQIPTYKVYRMEEMMKMTIEEKLRYTNLSFFSGGLYRDTRDYNRHYPGFLESAQDVYGDFLYLDDEDDFDDEDELDDDDFDEDDGFDDDEDDVSDLDEIDNSEVDADEMDWPCNGISESYEEIGQQLEAISDASNAGSAIIADNSGSPSSSRSSSIIVDPRAAITAMITGLQKGIHDIREKIRHGYDKKDNDKALSGERTSPHSLDTSIESLPEDEIVSDSIFDQADS